MITKIAHLLEQAAKAIPVLADDVAIFASTRLGRAKEESPVKAMESELMRKAKARAAMVKVSKVLSPAGRKRVSPHNFALPEVRKYPIHDVIHARNALARVAQHGTPEIQAKVRAAVFARYPKLKHS